MALLKLLLIGSIFICYSQFPCIEAQEFSLTDTKDSIDSDGGLHYPIYTGCGGAVEVEIDALVVIEYNLNEEYENNKMCVWTIRNSEALSMLLTKTSSGFEVGHDFLQITMIDNWISNNPTKHFFMGNSSGIEQQAVAGELGILVFSSDASNTGTGFRLEITARSRNSEAFRHDDFVSTSPTGSHSLRPYLPHTLTSWVIAPNVPEINLLELQVDYSTEPSEDEVVIFQLQRNGGVINHRLIDRMSGVGNECYTIEYYTTYVVYFISNLRTAQDGDGVTISWTGSNSGNHNACVEKMKV